MCITLVVLFVFCTISHNTLIIEGLLTYTLTTNLSWYLARDFIIGFEFICERVQLGTPAEQTVTLR